MDHPAGRTTLAVVLAATVLIGLNATMLSVALPSVVGDLGATPIQGTWMVLAYLVVSGAGLVLSGQLADCLHLGTVFRWGLGAFGAASLALAVAREPTVFIAARAVQGAGAALLLSTAAAIIAVAYPRERRKGAMGIYLAGFAIAQVSGPLIGGAVTSATGWRWLFVIGVVICGGSVVLGWRPLSRLPARRVRGIRVDLPGNALIVAAMTLVLVAFAGIQRVGWADVRTVGPLAVTALLVPAFVAVERRAPWPAIGVDLLRDRNFVVANLAAFCLVVARVVPAVLLSLWFQGVAGDDPVTAALKITPLAVAVTVGTLLVNRVARAADDVVVARRCAVGALVGSGLVLAAILRGGDLALLVAGLVVTGLGTGAFQTVNSTMIMGMRPVSQAGTVNGIRTTAQQAGVSLGTALLLSLVAVGLTPADAGTFFAGRTELLTAGARTELQHGYAVAISVLVGLCVAAVVASYALARGPLRGTLSTSTVI